MSCHKTQLLDLSDFFTKAFKHPCNPAPYAMLFGVANPEDVKSNWEARAISLSTLLARKLILQSWISEKSPTFEMWLTELGNVFHLEKIRYIMSAKEEFFHMLKTSVKNLYSSVLLICISLL